MRTVTIEKGRVCSGNRNLVCPFKPDGPYCACIFDCAWFSTSNEAGYEWAYCKDHCIGKIESAIPCTTDTRRTGECVVKAE